MNIAIIGGGWVGCHLAYKLKNNHKVSLFEKNDELFKETSYNNQNRLHLGYHYARNFKTRELCKTTFRHFLDEYGFLTEEIENNLYAVPKIYSTIDFQTYIQIYNEFNQIYSDIKFDNIEGCIKVDERYINFKQASKFFNEELSDIIIHETITNKKIKELSKDYDLVINATNNQIKDSSKNSFYELTLVLIYKKIRKTKFGGLTLVDGNFFSIYPYSDGFYTLTDVEFTPIKKFKNIETLRKLEQKIDNEYVLNRKDLMEKKVKIYFPEFSDYFAYNSFFLSTKSKIKSSSDERYPLITINKNIINCFTGKIQGIFIIEEAINNIINNYAC